MIRPKLSPRRPLVVAAAALAGLATAFAASSPALATSPSPSASATATASPSPTVTPTSPAPEGPACVSAADARYTHTFKGKRGEASITLVNGPLCEGQEQSFALVSYVAPSAKVAFPQYVLDKSVKKFTGVGAGELGVATLDFKVEVPQCYTQVDFVFGDEIIDPLTDNGSRYGHRKVGSPKAPGSQSTGKPQEAWYNGGSETCSPAPEVIAESDCEGNVELTLVNRSGNAAAAFTITGSGGYTETVSVPMRKIETRKLNPGQAQELKVTAPGMEDFTGGWAKPEDCQEPEAGEPDGGYESTCDELIFRIANPENGATLTSTFTPSTGEPKTVTVEAGRDVTVTFPASPGLTVTVTGDLASGEAIKWEQPKDCEDGEEGGSGGGDQEGGLPVTGAAAGGIAAGAVALLAVGAVLFVMARRRRIRFTA
ncbi:hypothetical protein GA0070558_101250 [Micromonospora haikouensis]|uniref:Cell wall anchor protein n=1 Tax=Micromonospora haikouensis TaxID=686309 RepID=A0A1C4TZ05_9ACTN|nr:hypothetical protein [Micromonospora haikouensis]SCE64673.1 hypothetical protein GA0070558_101250 [Micromonospora haikouensis]